MILFYSDLIEQMYNLNIVFQFHYDLILLNHVDSLSVHFLLFQFHYDLILLVICIYSINYNITISISL